MSKNIKRICANCKLFNPEKSECSVVILYEGERVKLPVSAEDPCFYEGQFFEPTTGAIENFADEIQQARFWVEDENGQKTDKNGTVKIEFPEGFFGEFEEGIFAKKN
jgi:hypothetical protein